MPENPEKHPCRSHGISLTWIYRNFILNVKPKVFAFIDHDMIPVSETSFDDLVKEQPFYGVLNAKPFGWSIWAGFSVFRFRDVENIKLNFNNDVSRNLDTGGRNWSLLYKKFDKSKLKFAVERKQKICLPKTREKIELWTIDKKWLHLCGAAYSKAFNAKQEKLKELESLTATGVALNKFIID